MMGGRGDIDDPDDYGDPGIYVEEVTPGSSVERSMEAGDQILKIGNVPVLDVPLYVALNLIRAADERIVIHILKHPDNMMLQIPEDSDDSGPNLEDEVEDEVGELAEVSSTMSKFSKASKGSKSSKVSNSTVVMMDETDMGEEVEVGFMSGRPGHLDDLDFEFAGGKDQPFLPKNGGIFITRVKFGSILEEAIVPGDRIIKLEGVDVTNVPQFTVTNLIRASHGKAKVTVRKANKQQINKSVFTEGDDVDVCVNTLGAKDEMIVEIRTGQRGRRGPIGFKITGGRDRPCIPGDPGIFIKAVKPGSKIEKILNPGDKILKVDGVNVTNATQGKVMDLIKFADRRVLLHIKKVSHDQLEKKNSSNVSQKFDAEKLEEYANAFEGYCKGTNQKIEASVLPRLCRALGFNLTAKDVEYMATANHNGTGRITFPEFLQMITYISSHQQKDADILEAFGVFDPEGQGYFSVNELKEAFQLMPGYTSISEDEMENILKIADSNNDGKVYYQDFKDLVLPIFHRY
ncbi:disks large 1 tumor suppressor protein-like [Actinia tenebrosa]|uniref:Disks large 1 tumor suppressor protein-like n=1 Tax=Actinia tenebrosa TaxID=6105 RepID=A0A6P8ILR3_ACTTE|nr:disks large 1 tumor suppressor protein-like [Actinia tenebrosa]